MSDESDRPSKSERKRRSDDLQALGEALIELPDSELSALPLPDALREAVELARRITQHGGLYRQKQYIGKLMRKIDAQPIRAALAAKREHERMAALRLRRVEQWRDRLIREGIPAIEQLAAELPQLDRHAVMSLVTSARSEQANGGSAHASRALFRLLREAFGT